MESTYKPLFTSIGKVSLRLHRTNIFEKYYLSEALSDVTLVVENERIPTHRFVIASQSDFFERLFFGNYKEKNQKEVEIQEASFNAFQLTLQYMYSKAIDLNTVEDLDVVVEALELSRRFGLEQLENGITAHLLTHLTSETIFQILPMAQLLDIQALVENIFAFIGQGAKKIFTDERFMAFNAENFCRALLEPQRNLGELQAFQTAQRWISIHDASPETIAKVLNCIELTRMSRLNIVQTIIPSKLYKIHFMQEMLQKIGFDIYDVSNCCDSEYFQKISHENYTKSGPMWIDGEQKHCIEVTLVDTYLINRIQMNIHHRTYSGYDIAVSADDGDTWTTVIRYAGLYCKQEQNLYFKEIPAKLIRIIANDCIKCNAFKVLLATEVPKLAVGFVCPVTNSGILANVRDRYSSSHSAWSAWATWTNEGVNTPFVNDPYIIFNQPYCLNRIRLRLWDFDGGKQHLKVGVHTLMGSYETVYETTQPEDGWQIIEFPNKVILEICITTKNPHEVARIAFFQAYMEDL